MVRLAGASLTAGSPRPASSPSTSVSTRTGPSSTTWAASTGSPCCASNQGSIFCNEIRKYNGDVCVKCIYLLCFSFKAILNASNNSTAISIKVERAVIACKTEMIGHIKQVTHTPGRETSAGA